MKKKNLKDSFTKINYEFTLAEVLITLGIIGVVAAMTLPTLIQTNKNKEVETKLQKIYSVMNQAILMSELDNGPKEYWSQSCGEGDSDIDCETYYDKYILKYLNNVSKKTFTDAKGYNVAIYFEDGTVLVGKAGYDYFFFPSGKNFDIESFSAESEDNPGVMLREGQGSTFFTFRFMPSSTSIKDKFHYKKGFEPYKYELEELSTEATKKGNYACKINGNGGYCTTMIQLNGWKIPDDYPFKVR